MRRHKHGALPLFIDTARCRRLPARATLLPPSASRLTCVPQTWAAARGWGPGAPHPVKVGVRSLLFNRQAMQTFA